MMCHICLEPLGNPNCSYCRPPGTYEEELASNSKFGKKVLDELETQLHQMVESGHLEVLGPQCTHPGCARLATYHLPGVGFWCDQHQANRGREMPNANETRARQQEGERQRAKVRQAVMASVLVGSRTEAAKDLVSHIDYRSAYPQEVVEEAMKQSGEDWREKLRKDLESMTGNPNALPLVLDLVTLANASKDGCIAMFQAAITACFVRGAPKDELLEMVGIMYDQIQKADAQIHPALRRLFNRPPAKDEPS